MEKTLQELADLLQGKILQGDPAMVIKGVNGLEEARPDQISFAVPPYLEIAGQSHAGAIMIPEGGSLKGNQAVLSVENPRAAFARLLQLFRPPEKVNRGISQYAFIHLSAKVGKGVAILPFAYVAEDAEIGDNTVIYPHVYVGRHVKIGSDCTLYPNVTVRENCVVGDRVILQAGCVIGGDGFGYITANGKHTKVLQTGNVVLGDDVEIGCNTCIDRATVDSTVVGKGTKIDNLVHVGHNDIIGENCILVAHVGISGSVTIGDNCTFGGQAATAGHLKIGRGCTFAGRTGIISDVPDGVVWAGFPAQPHVDWLRQVANERKLGGLLKRLRQLEKTVEKLESEKKE
ncbi:UDP-3-O-(3-hydroxymyristoyl)glucosamine N-acyltransferase [Acidaminococcus timonensis]|uniref:UDP-3-O-(3-hydroxymyristoyl)glucosamine N-acyltransferase n=1 Tax=Acidaminococcus timonensis TaxID=1871002 RepID=UPI00248B7E3A|nr:UDP-3-O-(3-hydroxymyristoyl)glucosamine N-acyltransferase [Acidaminococcus timonensis]